jgi:hypothetical protein
MGFQIKEKSRLGGQMPQFKEDKPGKKLGFPPIWVPEGQNAATFPAQGPLEGGKQMSFPP